MAQPLKQGEGERWANNPMQTNPTTKERARELRRNQTGPERALWKLIRDRRLRHLKFRRQHPIEQYIFDFYCHAAGLVVEVDGESHDGCGEYDKERTRHLERRELTVLRVSNDDVLKESEAVLLAIARAAGIDVTEWMNETIGE